MRLKMLALSVIMITFVSCKDKYSHLPDGLYAEIETGKGTIIASLEYEKTPITVANFVTLAEGKNTFVAENFKGKPFYNGLKFHRVLQNFMIQGGDPLGNGSGDTGYKFKDEITDLLHDKGGILSMANSGPGTNSSQFFITHTATPWLDGKHTVFGHVVEGMETVNKIIQDDTIVSITIIRKGDGAKKFDAVKVFGDYFSNQAEIDAKELEARKEKMSSVLAEKLAYFKENKEKATKTASGLQYYILKKGNGTKPAKGTDVNILYAGYFENGELFDSNVVEVAQAYGVYNEMRAAQGGYEPIVFKAGNKQGMIPGFIEGLDQLSYGDKAIVFIPANLAYGEAGAGNVIPPNTNLIFEIELSEKTAN